MYAAILQEFNYYVNCNCPIIYYLYFCHFTQDFWFFFEKKCEETLFFVSMQYLENTYVV